MHVCVCVRVIVIASMMYLLISILVVHCVCVCLQKRGIDILLRPHHWQYLHVFWSGSVPGGDHWYGGSTLALEEIQRQ